MLLLLLLLPLLPSISADTPADCRYEDVVGVWEFAIGETSADSAVDCAGVEEKKLFADPKTKYTVNIVYPNVAVDQFGNDGFWTMVYNQGFEVEVAGRKFFAFSKYKQEGKRVTSFCGETTTGWTHNVVGRNWGCYGARKTTPVPPKNHTVPYFLDAPSPDVQRLAQLHFNTFLTSYFSSSSGLAVTSLEDMIRLAGGRKSMTSWRPNSVKAKPEVLLMAQTLPEKWDWRNVSGVNYVSPVRNQGGCGSCYAFASMGMLETRLRVLSNNRLRLSLSPQDIVECSKYSQGCDGGFPYLIAGKYTEDFGAVPESCNPYKGVDGKCSTSPDCKTRYFGTKYKYVGGYFGGCSEQDMMISLVRNGPIAVAFEVSEPFLHYHGGIWRCDESSRRSTLPLALKKFYPFELTNHAVLLVGYGEDDQTGEKFWIVKNSWSESWGENGYFRIRRGQDDCAIESCAVEAFPIF